MIGWIRRTVREITGRFGHAQDSVSAGARTSVSRSKSVEQSSTVEPRRSAGATRAEAKRAAEARRVAEARRAAEARQAAEAQRVAEAKQAADAMRIAEAQLAEAKRIAEAKRAEIKRPTETKRAAAPTARRGRPISDSMARTLECLKENPEVTPAEIADALSVSRDYARTLLRRAKTKAAQDAPAPKFANAVSVRERQRPGKVQPPEPAEDPIVPFPAANLQSINLNRRSQVLRLVDQGNSPQDVAATIGIPLGEVDFILKVDRLLRTAF